MFGGHAEIDAGIWGEVGVEFGKWFQSVCEFELETCRFVDARGNLHLVVDSRRKKVEAYFVDPFAAVFGTDLEISQHVLGFEGKDVQGADQFIGGYFDLVSSSNFDNVAEEVVGDVARRNDVYFQVFALVVLGKRKRKF